MNFGKTKNNKVIQFTIANPYILEEQYSGAVPSGNIHGQRTDPGMVLEKRKIAKY
jgi:hypothetical protein